MQTRCPCCDEALQEPEEAGLAEDLSDARPGDRWCPNCGWILLREVLESPAVWSELECPRHGPLNDRLGP